MDIQKIIDHAKILSSRYNDKITWKYDSRTNTFKFYQKETILVDEVENIQESDETDEFYE